MQDVLTLESKRIAEEFYALLQSLDPSRRDATTLERGRGTLKRIQAQLETLLVQYREQTQYRDQASSAGRAPLSPRLKAVAAVIAEAAPSPELAGREEISAWNRFRRRAYPTYEALAAALKDYEIHVPSLRPTNYYRNLFHVASGFMVLLAVQHLLNPVTIVLVPLATVIWAWNMEYFRRFKPGLNALLMKAFGRMAHPHEAYRVNSATWYATALLIIALTSDTLTASLAVTQLGLGDPSAAIIGRRFGRIRLIAGRSLEGTTAFVVAASLGSVAMMMVYYPALSLQQLTLLALGSAIPAAIAELFSKRIDDNFSIPLASALGATITRALLGF